MIKKPDFFWSLLEGKGLGQMTLIPNKVIDSYISFIICLFAVNVL